MKKILVAFAIAAFASTSLASIAGSAHDMRAAPYLGTKGACQYCHAPHLWVDPTPLTIAPLWNRTVLDAGSITNRAGDIVTEVTRACISCHDGVTQLGDMNNNPDLGLTAVVPATANVGTSLLNDHPVGVILVAGAEYQVPPAAFIMDEGTVGCSTCHDVHNQTGFTSFLVVDQTTTDICAQCHTK